MRRLSVLRKFAKRVRLEFDIENMDISLLTYANKTKKLRKKKDDSDDESSEEDE